DDEGFGEAVGLRLLGIGEADAEIAAVAEQRPELRQIARRRDDQDVADPRQHEHAQRIIYHGLVENWQQLFRDGECSRKQAGAASSSKYYSLHQLPASLLLGKILICSDQERTGKACSFLRGPSYIVRCNVRKVTFRRSLKNYSRRSAQAS